MNLNKLKNLYNNSPLWLKKLYSSIPYEIRNGSDYRKWKTFLENELNEEEYQLLKLKETISYAYNNTIYYKNEFNKLSLSPNDINELKDIQKIPTIDKDIVRKNYNELIASNFSIKKSFFVTTGGSSGEPMKFLQSKNIWYKELAFLYHLFSTYNYSPNMLKASFRGGNFNNTTKNVYWKHNPIQNEIHFSPFHLSYETIKLYVDKLNDLKPLIYHSYPSSLLLLLEAMKEMNLTFTYRPSLVILISENYTNEDIIKIQDFFRCKVISFYGHSERLIFAPTITEKLDSSKIDSKYGLFELINDNNIGISENFLRGEMVGTSFDNYAMPLIRYRTEDFTFFENYKKLEIGKIEGRWGQEYLDGTNGAKIYLTALNMHSDIFKNIIQFQFLQKSFGVVDFLIINKQNFSDNDEKKILNALNSKAGHAINFKILKVKYLKLTPRGKIKKIIKQNCINSLTK